MKQLNLRSGYIFLLILSCDWISLFARFPSSAVLSLLGPPQEAVSSQSHSCSVHCGCSSRDFSVLIQEFLKSLTLWVPEAFLYMSSTLLLALQWLPSTESQCSLQVDLIPIHLAVHTGSLLVLLPALSPLSLTAHPDRFQLLSNVESTSIQTFHLNLGLLPFHTPNLVPFKSHVYLQYIFNPLPQSKLQIHLQFIDI